MVDDPKTLRHLAEELETELRLVKTERNWFIEALHRTEEKLAQAPNESQVRKWRLAAVFWFLAWALSYIPVLLWITK